MLGTVFNYPDILAEPVEDILAAFRAHQTAVVAWFIVMALSAALFVPIAVGVGRLPSNRAMKVAVPVGMAAGVVQVVGLLRWPLLVPGFARDAASSDAAVAAAARHGFVLAHRILGTTIGETLGYLLTAGWTLLVLVALGGWIARRWFTALGAVAAVLILGGVLTPLQVPGVDFGNFVGYILWSVWLIIFAVLILRHSHTPDGAATPARSGTAGTLTS